MYPKLIALIGKNESSEEFLSFVAEQGQLPRVYDVGVYRFFDLHHIGISLTYNLSIETFSSITFHLQTVGVDAGEISAYEHELPANLVTLDGFDASVEKLGIPPERAGWVRGCQSDSCLPSSEQGSYWAHYELPPFHYVLSFDHRRSSLRMVVQRISRIVRVDELPVLFGGDNSEYLFPHT